MGKRYTKKHRQKRRRRGGADVNEHALLDLYNNEHGFKNIRKSLGITALQPSVQITFPKAASRWEKLNDGTLNSLAATNITYICEFNRVGEFIGLTDRWGLPLQWIALETTGYSVRDLSFVESVLEINTKNERQVIITETYEPRRWMNKPPFSRKIYYDAELAYVTIQGEASTIQQRLTVKNAQNIPNETPDAKTEYMTQLLEVLVGFRDKSTVKRRKKIEGLPGPAILLTDKFLHKN